MYSGPDPHGGEPVHPAENILRGLRVIGAVIGIALIVAGAALAYGLFQHIASRAEQPEKLAGLVDGWENLLRPRLNFADTREADAQSTSTMLRGLDLANPDTYPAAIGEALLHGARPMAVLILILILGILARLALAFVTTGATLLSLAAGEVLYQKKLLALLKRELPRQ